jgi:hypothetical protein
MPLRVRTLEIRVTTHNGPFGVRIAFGDGLTIIHADNTSGKSTCLMSVLYALGLEGMLGPSQDPPLTAAMLRSLTYNDEQYRVVQSEVFLEIEGQSGAVVTLHRMVTGALKERQLVVVYDGSVITRPDPRYRRTSYFVRTSGSAQSESGFHRFLAKFIGLELPELTDFEGEKRPLYLESIFPFFFVEQLTGWRDIKARMPTYLQVPEMAKRTAEYVMKLDILYRSLRRQELRQRAKQITAEWSKALDQSLFGSFGLGFVIRGIPDSPVEVWPPHHPPNLYVATDMKWKTIDGVIAVEREHIRRLTEEEIPQARYVTAETKAAISRLEEELRAAEQVYDRLLMAVSNEEEQLRAIEERLSSLREDRRKYQDEQMLRSRGASDEFSIQVNHCPICDRPLNDALLPQVRLINPMSLEENVAFIKDQISTFEYMQTDTIGVLEAKQKMLHAARGRLYDISGQIRALKETLRSDGHLPSAAAIRERLQHEGLFERLSTLKDAFDERLKTFAQLSRTWRDIQNEIKEVRDTQLTSSDNRKISILEHSFKSQLRQYRFSSFPVDEIGISRESYRPSHNGYDLGFTSASDTIRAIWAYLLGLLELSRQVSTNHLGLLFFDEPKQQSAAKVSFGALLARASSAIQYGQQVVFATSEEEASLSELLKGFECPITRLRYDEKMLRPYSWT